MVSRERQSRAEQPDCHNPNSRFSFHEEHLSLLSNRPQNGARGLVADRHKGARATFAG
jgi:hypothetical protein